MTRDYDERSLIHLPRASLVNTTLGTQRIMSGMVGEMIGLVRNTTVLHTKPKLKRILIVENDPVLSDALKEILESVSFAILTVPDGVEGLRAVLDADFDVVICNIMMPRMTGDMLYFEIERVKPHMCERFIFITGNYDNPETKEFLHQIKATFLPMPFELSSLLDAISLLVKSEFVRP